VKKIVSIKLKNIQMIECKRFTYPEDKNWRHTRCRWHPSCRRRNRQSAL